MIERATIQEIVQAAVYDDDSDTAADKILALIAATFTTVHVLSYEALSLWAVESNDYWEVSGREGFRALVPTSDLAEMNHLLDPDFRGRSAPPRIPQQS